MKRYNSFNHKASSINTAKKNENMNGWGWGGRERTVKTRNVVSIDGTLTIMTGPKSSRLSTDRALQKTRNHAQKRIVCLETS
jgi:hypothetical protein